MMVPEILAYPGPFVQEIALLNSQDELWAVFLQPETLAAAAKNILIVANFYQPRIFQPR
jgi:hypothetical protein